MAFDNVTTEAIDQAYEDCARALEERITNSGYLIKPSEIAGLFADIKALAEIKEKLARASSANCP